MDNFEVIGPATLTMAIALIINNVRAETKDGIRFITSLVTGIFISVFYGISFGDISKVLFSGGEGNVILLTLQAIYYGVGYGIGASGLWSGAKSLGIVKKQSSVSSANTVEHSGLLRSVGCSALRHKTILALVVATAVGTVIVSLVPEFGEPEKRSLLSSILISLIWPSK